MNSYLDYYEGNGLTFDELYAFVKDCIDSDIDMNTPIMFSTTTEDITVPIKAVTVDNNKIIFKQYI